MSEATPIHRTLFLKPRGRDCGSISSILLRALGRLALCQPRAGDRQKQPTTGSD